MKVVELMKVLEGIATGLAGVATSASKELNGFQEKMRPFGEEKVEDFVQFLVQCDEYKRTGIIPGKSSPKPRKPAKEKLSVADAAAAVQQVLDRINFGEVTGQSIEETVGRFNQLTKPQLQELLQRLNIQGKASTKLIGLGKIKQVLNTQLEMYIRTHPLPASTEARPTQAASAPAGSL